MFNAISLELKDDKKAQKLIANTPKTDDQII
jgi:hypothetical protein